MTFDWLAKNDFERAVSKGVWGRLLAFLTGKSNELLPFEAVRERLPIQGQRYLGMQQIKIDNIIGSVGRFNDFDRAFLPLHSRTRERWVSIDMAHLAQRDLPPIEVYKIGEVYFVKDGNHRVSVARERGQVYIDAYVTEIDVPVPLTPDLKEDDLALKEALACFLDATHLHKSRPQADFNAHSSEAYVDLLEHISVHRWYLGEKAGAEVTLAEAALSWHDKVYQPLVVALGEQHLLKDFPGASAVELYLWFSKYQWYLRMAYQNAPMPAVQDADPDAPPLRPHTDAALLASASLLTPILPESGGLAPLVPLASETSPTSFPEPALPQKEQAARAQKQAAQESAARQVVQDEKLPLTRKLINVLRKADWVEERLLEEDRVTFLERTRLTELRPEADIHFSMPGQYRLLLEHIDVHCWYLGKQRSSEVPYAEAVASWYDNVYLPLVQMVREQNWLQQFPHHTEADMYLWLINRKPLLSQYLEKDEASEE